MGARAASLKVDQFADKRWRLNNLYMIVDETGHKVPFHMNWAQEELFGTMWYLNLILKARQLGFTTFVALYMLDECVFNSNVRAGLIAHNLNDAKVIFRDKVRFPYDNLPEEIRNIRPTVEDSADCLTLSNNSSLRVGTSLRSGTNHYLHVSEYGKICAKYPEKAVEIRTGALNTVHKGQVVWIESTAEGKGGDFFDKCEEAQTHHRLGDKLTEMDFKFHFFPWWKHPEYQMDPEDVVFPKAMLDYFAKIEGKGVILTDAQKAWYAKKAKQQKAEMKREFPSTPEEAFEAVVEGAIYGEWMAELEEEGRVCDLPVEPGSAVETWWDLGLHDSMVIWWVQRVGPWIHVIDHYSNRGKGLAHYAEILQARQQERKLVYAKPAVIWPHDGTHKIMDEHGRQRTAVMAGLGYEPSIVQRGAISDGIDATRTMLPKCRFDRLRTEKGRDALKAYQYEVDDAGNWSREPLHNWASDHADALRTGAMYKPMRGAFRKLEYQKLPIV